MTFSFSIYNISTNSYALLKFKNKTTNKKLREASPKNQVPPENIPISGCGNPPRYKVGFGSNGLIWFNLSPAGNVSIPAVGHSANWKWISFACFRLYFLTSIFFRHFFFSNFVIHDLRATNAHTHDMWWWSWFMGPKLDDWVSVSTRAKRKEWFRSIFGTNLGRLHPVGLIQSFLVSRWKF